MTALDVLKIENFAADAFAHDLERILLGMGQNSTKGELESKGTEAINPRPAADVPAPDTRQGD